MFIIILFSIFLTPLMSLSMVNTTVSNYSAPITYSQPAPVSVNNLDTGCVRNRKLNKAPVCAIEITDSKLPQSIVEAISSNNIAPIKCHFQLTVDFLMRRKQLNQALLLIAPQPPNPNQDLLSFLLYEIEPRVLTGVECILSHAAHNGHTRIVEYCRDHFNPAMIMAPFLQAVRDNDVPAVETLLAGLDANYRPSNWSFNPLLVTAVYQGRPECVRALVNRKVYVMEMDTQKDRTAIDAAFLLLKNTDASNTEEFSCRLAVIQELFKGVPFNMVDSELKSQVKIIAPDVQKKVIDAVNQTLYPSQLTMTEEAEYRQIKKDQAQVLDIMSYCCKGLGIGTLCCILCKQADERNEQEQPQ